MRLFFQVSALAFLAAVLSHGQGGSAVITLVVPPPGGEGFAMLQSGGMFANGATSAYYNPALIADLERNTGSQLHYSGSRQDLFEVTYSPNPYQSHHAFALTFPDPAGGWDIGVGLFRNYLQFGDYITDPYGVMTDTSASDETVYGAALGIRLGLPLSVGGTVKFYDSRLSEGSVSSNGTRLHGRAQGWAFDLGMLANPRISLPSAWKAPWMEFTPSGSLVVQNIGPEAFYDDAAQSDPIPLTLTYGIGLQGKLFDMAEFEAGSLREQEIADRDDYVDFSLEPTWKYGFSAKLLLYRYSMGWLKDDQGGRDQLHTGYSLDLDMLGFYRVWKRVSRRDFRSPPAVLDAGFPFARTTLLGMPFRANPRLSLGWRKIEFRDNGFSDPRKAFFLAVSL